MSVKFGKSRPAHSVKLLEVQGPVESKGFVNQSRKRMAEPPKAKGTGRQAKQGLPLHLQRHKFKMGLAGMRKMGRGG